jgi:broad specificity phosphatase PhoE
MDVIKRLESVIIEVERENESVCIVGHQAILRCVYAYFMQVPREVVRPPPPLLCLLFSLATTSTEAHHSSCLPCLSCSMLCAL